jgi:hypothetical protein
VKEERRSKMKTRQARSFDEEKGLGNGRARVVLYSYS